ncbi:MAG: hypothetical protein KAU35_11045 [candidate division Zixibacteria bacterium]|nr:hypothetical protein [candidate division Zixibacteria bacterium]
MDEWIAGFEARKHTLLLNTAKTVSSAERKADPYGNSAMAALLLGLDEDMCNSVLCHVAEWFDHSHPTGRSHDGECDFAAMKLCRAFHLFRNGSLLSRHTLQRIKRFFLTQDFKSKYDSENHHLLFRTSRYLMSSVWLDSSFEAYGRAGQELAAADANWLDAYIRFRARRGWGEFDSSCYIVPDLECLFGLYDYAPSPKLRRLAEMMITVLLADMAVDSLEGMYCGPHGRIYEAHALDHRNEPSFPLQYLYFGDVPQDWLGDRGTLVDALVSDYRPPDILLRIATRRRKPYENLERKHLHNTSDVLPSQPFAGSIRKYTYWTPHYVLGCVQRQDPYPADCPGRWYSHHEQHEWDLTIAGHPRTRIFTHHPGKKGNEHGYWTGDLSCGCGYFLQHRNILLALYDIPPGEPYQYIHAYVPREAFDGILERDGLLVLRKNKVLVGLRLLGGYTWTTSGPYRDKEVISHGPRNGVICEVGLLSDYGSPEALADEMAANETSFDDKVMVLCYRSHRTGELRLNTRGLREVNGQELDLEYPTYSCPYLHSDWDSGVIDLKHGGNHARLDFRETCDDSVALKVAGLGCEQGAPADADKPRR